MRFVTSLLLSGLLLSALALFPATAIAPSHAPAQLLAANESHSYLLANSKRPKHRGSGRRDLMEYTQVIPGLA